VDLHLSPILSYEFLNVYYEKNTFTLNDIILPLKTRGAYIEKEKIEVAK